MNRRKTDMTESAKPAIIKAIADCKDDNMRAVLLLMLAVLEEIGAKIDMVMSDEKTIREMVLNGHSAVHDDDHVWIAQYRESRPGGKCAYVLRKEREEAEAAGSRRKISEEVISKILIAVFSILGTLMFAGMLKSLGM